MNEQNSVFESPLRISYVPPRWIFSCLVLTIVGALVCVISLALSWTVKALLILPVLALLKFGDFSQPRPQQLGLILDAKDRWFIDAEGETGIPVRLIHASIPVPEFIVLVLQTKEGKKYRFFLSSACADETSLRRLRIRLYYPKVRVG